MSLQRRGPDGWVRVAKAPTDESGAVTLAAPPATETAATGSGRPRAQRAVAGGDAPDGHGVGEPAEGSEDSFVITGSAQGGFAGDRVRLYTRRHGERVVVAEGFLDGNGSVQFLVTPTKRPTRYLVVLEKTTRHTAGHAGIRVSKQNNRH